MKKIFSFFVVSNKKIEINAFDNKHFGKFCKLCDFGRFL